MKRLALLALLPAIAFGQLAGVDGVTLSSVSSGDEVTRWIDNEYPITDDPYPENYIYVDGTTLNSWAPGSIPSGFEGIWLVHTNTTDASTSDASLVSFTTSGRSQVCVLWPEAVADPGWLATDSYLDSGRVVAAGGNNYDMYCAMKDAGALAFGDSDDPMYLVSVGPAWRAQPPINTPSPDENGFYVFATDAYEISEDATTGGNPEDPKFRRITGSDGAVTVDVDDAASTTCSTADFDFALYPTTPTATIPVTGSWADQELGNKFLNIAVADVSADCIIVLEFENATGGISAGADRQTATITVRDVTSPPVSAGDLFVEIGGSGDDANDCTTGTPCLTIQRAQALAVADDVIEIQVSGTGTGTYTACTSFTNTLPTTNTEIELRVRSGDTVNFLPTSCGTPNNSIIYFANSVSHFKIDGSVGTMVFGQASDWDEIKANETFVHGMVFGSGGNVSYIEIDSVTAYGGGGNQGKCNRIQNNDHHWYIHDSAFEYCGSNWDPAVGDDYGDLWNVQGENNLIVNNTFAHGGHEMLGIYGYENVIRGNTFDADWTDTTTGKPGARCFAYAAGNNLRGGQSPYGPGLFEGNICINSDNAESDHGTYGKWEGYRTIIRQNMFCENNDAGVAITTSSSGYTDVDGAQVESQRIYHNTFINNDMWLRVTDDAGNPNHLDMRYVNNLGDNFAGYNAGNATDNLDVIIYQNTAQTPSQGSPNGWMSSVFRNNWIHSAEYTVRMRQRDSGTHDWPTDAATNWPANFTDNATTRATFSGYTDASDCNETGLAISGNGVGEATYLTTVTTGTTGTAIAVGDTWYFGDDFDLSYYGEAGDYVEFQDAGGGNSRIRQINSITSQTQFVLTASVTVAAGDEVRLVESDGTTVVDNMGAAQ